MAMLLAQRFVFRLLPACALVTALAACAPAPIYKSGPATVTATPRQVATAPNNFTGSQVIWGGEVIGVTNMQNHTEIRVLAYPLDSSQRPRLKKHAEGRFAAIIPGFLDPMNYPKGALVTMRGEIGGTVTGSVGEATYVYPALKVHEGNLHRWTSEEMRKGHPNISFGVGVGGVIR
jgi:outer membrane lipoprotein